MSVPTVILDLGSWLLLYHLYSSPTPSPIPYRPDIPRFAFLLVGRPNAPTSCRIACQPSSPSLALGDRYSDAVDRTCTRSSRDLHLDHHSFPFLELVYDSPCSIPAFLSRACSENRKHGEFAKPGHQIHPPRQPTSMIHIPSKSISATYSPYLLQASLHTSALNPCLSRQGTGGGGGDHAATHLKWTGSLLRPPCRHHRQPT